MVTGAWRGDGLGRASRRPTAEFTQLRPDDITRKRAVVRILIYDEPAPQIVVNELICLSRDGHEPLNENI